MSNHKTLGAIGEQYACEYLQQQGYSIIKRNYRIKIGELDIIAQKEDTVVFVEVKTRYSLSYGYGMESITLRKQRTIRKIAEFYYQMLKNPTLKARIDVIDIVMGNGQVPLKIKHIENAF